MLGVRHYSRRLAFPDENASNAEAAAAEQNSMRYDSDAMRHCVLVVIPPASM